MRKHLSIIALTYVIFAWPHPINAKGVPERIVINGGGLARPIEIADRETLRGFNPWAGQFIDWPKGVVAAPPNHATSYEIFFYMKWSERHSRYDRGDLNMIYSMRYCPSQHGGPGYVYLPGKEDANDDRYSINIGTIWRKDDDGKWHQASTAWDALMKRLTVANNAAGSSEVSFVTTRLGTYFKVGLALGAAVVLLIAVAVRKAKAQRLQAVPGLARSDDRA